MNGPGKVNFNFNIKFNGKTYESFLLVLKNGEQVSLTGSQFVEMDVIIEQIKQSVYAELLPTLEYGL